MPSLYFVTRQPKYTAGFVILWPLCYINHMGSVLSALARNKRRLYYAILIVMLVWSIVQGYVFNVIWIMATFAIAFLLAFLVISTMLLPVDNSAEEKNELRDLFIRFLMGEYLYFVVVREGKVVAPATKEKRKTRVKEKEKPKPPAEGPWVYGRGAILTDGSSVVVMKTETGISQVIGPGSTDEGKRRQAISVGR